MHPTAPFLLTFESENDRFIHVVCQRQPPSSFLKYCPHDVEVPLWSNILLPAPQHSRQKYSTRLEYVATERDTVYGCFRLRFGACSHPDAPL